ncbi:MAG: hypothetical protein ACPG31_07675 [Planctomycetota bacterium]
MKTSFLLAGLLLATPLTAQTDNVQELKAAELLRLSAEKAAAGHETAAAELAEKAMHMLRAEADKHRAQAELAQAKARAQEAQALAQLGYVGEVQEPKVKAEARGIMIVEGPNGREVIEFTPDMQGHGSADGPMGLFEIAIEEDCGDCDESCETECEEIVECESEGDWFTDVNEVARRHGGGAAEFMWAPESDFEHEGGAFLFESDGNYFFAQNPHEAPHQDDLHHQLASIQHELEALRHELAMLRAEMGGMSGRRSMRNPMGNTMMLQGHSGRFPGQMQMRAPRMQFRMAPGMHEMETIDLQGFGLQDLDLEDIRIQMKDLEGLHGFEGNHDLHIEHHESHENGAQVESKVKVIINGEVYEGNAAREKLAELGHTMPAMPEMPRVQLRTRVAPTPPVPPVPPAPSGEWRRSKGSDQEDL